MNPKKDLQKHFCKTNIQNRIAYKKSTTPLPSSFHTQANTNTWISILKYVCLHFFFWVFCFHSVVSSLSCASTTERKMCNNLRESTIQGMTSDMSPLIVSTDSSRVCVNLLQPLTSTWGDCLSNKQQRNLDPSTNRDHQARRTVSLTVTKKKKGEKKGEKIARKVFIVFAFVLPLSNVPFQVC